jgi:hypothetical protein
MGKGHACCILLIIHLAYVESLVSHHFIGMKDRLSMSDSLKPHVPIGHNDIHQTLKLRGGDSAGEQTSEQPQEAAQAPTTDSLKWAPSAASELHDNINIVILTALGLSSICALSFGEAFFGNLLTWVGFVYIGLDSLWLIVQPSIVKSPKMILGHHIATLLVLLDPLLQPSHSVYTSACLLVEVIRSTTFDSLLNTAGRHSEQSSGRSCDAVAHIRQ